MLIRSQCGDPAWHLPCQVGCPRMPWTWVYYFTVKFACKALKWNYFHPSVPALRRIVKSQERKARAKAKSHSFPVRRPTRRSTAPALRFGLLIRNPPARGGQLGRCAPWNSFPVDTRRVRIACFIPSGDASSAVHGSTFTAKRGLWFLVILSSCQASCPYRVFVAQPVIEADAVVISSAWHNLHRRAA